MTNGWPRGWPAMIYIAIASDYRYRDLTTNDLICACLFNDTPNSPEYVTRGMLYAEDSSGNVAWSSINGEFDVTANPTSGTLTLTANRRYFSSSVEYTAITITQT